MENFEQVRGHLNSSGYKVTMHDPFVACVELSLGNGKRHQAIFLSELGNDDERGYLRVSTVIAPMTGIDAKRALKFNWQSSVGYGTSRTGFAIPCVVWTTPGSPRQTRRTLCASF